MAEAGSAKGTFFAYFPTFDDLLEALRAEQAAELEQAVSDALGSAAKPDWETALPRLAGAFVDSVIAMGGLHEVLFHSAFTQARPTPPERRPAARIAAILRAGLAAGAYADLDPDPTATLIFSAIHETADAIAAGADRDRSLAALDRLLRRAVFATDRPSVVAAGDL